MGQNTDLRCCAAFDLLGIGTALKILFSNVYGVPLEMKLRRCEVVALLNAFGRISESIGAVERFSSYYASPLVFYDHDCAGQGFPRSQWILRANVSLWICRRPLGPTDRRLLLLPTRRRQGGAGPEIRKGQGQKTVTRQHGPVIYINGVRRLD